MAPYEEEWVRVFYATVWFAPERAGITFMFQGHQITLTRAALEVILGVSQEDTSLHQLVYDLADPPRRALVGGTAPEYTSVNFLFRQPFLASYPRALDLLTEEAFTVHMALWRTLLPRTGYPEGFTALQQ